MRWIFLLLILLSACNNSQKNIQVFFDNKLVGDFTLVDKLWIEKSDRYFVDQKKLKQLSEFCLKLNEFETVDSNDDLGISSSQFKIRCDNKEIVIGKLNKFLAKFYFQEGTTKAVASQDYLAYVGANSQFYFSSTPFETLKEIKKIVLTSGASKRELLKQNTGWTTTDNTHTASFKKLQELLENLPNQKFETLEVDLPTQEQIKLEFHDATNHIWVLKFFLTEDGKTVLKINNWEVAYLTDLNTFDLDVGIEGFGKQKNIFGFETLKPDKISVRGREDFEFSPIGSTCQIDGSKCDFVFVEKFLTSLDLLKPIAFIDEPPNFSALAIYQIEVLFKNRRQSVRAIPQTMAKNGKVGYPITSSQVIGYYLIDERTFKNIFPRLEILKQTN